MKSLINKDLESAKKLEAELTERLFEAAEPDLLAGGNGIATAPLTLIQPATSIAMFTEMLSLDRASKENSLIEVRIKLGKIERKRRHRPVRAKADRQQNCRQQLVRALRSKARTDLVLIEGIFQSKQGDKLADQSAPLQALVVP